MDTDDFPEPTDGTESPQTTEPPGPTDCPPAQWDCPTALSCDYLPDGPGELHPVVSVDAACKCDFSRPASPQDCPENQLFVCGHLGSTDTVAFIEGPGLRFEPVSCRCAVNSGYYCAHCLETGLYESVEDAAGCVLSGEILSTRQTLICGCGARTAP